jgi:hypothetical protein
MVKGKLWNASGGIMSKCRKSFSLSCFAFGYTGQRWLDTAAAICYNRLRSNTIVYCSPFKVYTLFDSSKLEIICKKVQAVGLIYK